MLRYATYSRHYLAGSRGVKWRAAKPHTASRSIHLAKGLKNAQIYYRCLRLPISYFKLIMTIIKQEDLIESVAAALQFISYYHPTDYIRHLARAYEREQSAAAKDAIAQILTNSRMCAEGKRPICQDTGIVNVFLKIGMDVRFEGFVGSITDAINEGVRRGYNNTDNKLRASVVADPQLHQSAATGGDARTPRWRF